MAQVINTLSHFGLVKTTRGRHGGVTLERSPEEIVVGDVFRRLESHVPFAECFAADANTCPIAGFCRLQGKLNKALDAFYKALDEVTLADLVKDNTALEDALTLP
jgi:Rrf2 family nitric oxide-sensitive transcriptional repressor